MKQKLRNPFRELQQPLSVESVGYQSINQLQLRLSSLEPLFAFVSLLDLFSSSHYRFFRLSPSLIFKVFP